MNRRLKCWKILLDSRGKVQRCERMKQLDNQYGPAVRLVGKNGYETYRIFASTRRVAMVSAMREFTYARMGICRN